MKPWMWLTGAALAGLIAGFAWPPPAISRAQLAQADVWALPSTPALTRSAPEAMQAARTGLRWAAESDEAVEAVSGGTWTLSGLAHADGPFALISSGAKVQRLQIGGTLPDGGKLEAIGRDRVTVTNGDCRRTYQLYRAQPIEQSGICPDQTDSTL